MTYAVEFQNVSRLYGDVRAVDGVSIGIRDGEFFSMLGPSGSGKTTCLRLMAGFEQPDLGVVRLGGIDAGGLPPYQRDVNTVFQDYALFPHLSVRQNVAFGLRRGWRNPPRGCRIAAVEHWLQAFGIDTIGDLLPAQISGGQRQRTALARALVTRPQALLLDEPFAALDHALRAHLRREPEGVLEETGIPLLLISHDPEDVALCGQQVVHMADGRMQA